MNTTQPEPRVNTRLAYVYRDANNNKKYNEIVLAGELTYDDIEPFLFDDDGFIAGDVGLEELQLRWPRGPSAADHVYHEIHPSFLSHTEDDPTVPFTADELRKRFEDTDGDWDETSAVKRLGLSKIFWESTISMLRQLAPSSSVQAVIQALEKHVKPTIPM